MSYQNSRIDRGFVEQQKLKRKELSEAPSQAGGLPAVNDRIQIIEEILALHSYVHL